MLNSKMKSALVFSLLYACNGQQPSELRQEENTTSELSQSVVSLVQEAKSYCTASLIAEDLLLTSASCVQGRKASDIQVSFSKLPEELRSVSEIQSFKEDSPKYFPYFDVAYLKLTSPAPAPYQAIEILRNIRKLENIDSLVIAGTNECEAECESTPYEESVELKNLITSEYSLDFLLLGVSGDGLCYQDSGGPVFAELNGRWYLAGSLLGGFSNPGACRTGEPLYSFLGDYVDWIETTAKVDLMQDGRRNRNPRAVQVDSLEEMSGTWKDWLEFNNYEEPSWFTMIFLRSLVSEGIDLKTALMASSEFFEARLSKLEVFDFPGVVSDFSGVGVFDQQLEDIAAFKLLSGLEVAVFESHAIKDYSPLSGLESLKHLLISDNKLVSKSDLPIDFDVSFINELELESLSLDGISGKPLNIRSIDWSRQKSLASLMLTNTNLASADIAKISELEAIENLFLAKNVLRDISFLSGLSSLKVLDLSSNEIRSVSGLSELGSLEYLDLSKNPELDLTTIDWSKLSSLKTLILSESMISDISVLAGLEKLEILDLSGNAIESIETLSSLSSLKTIKLSSNQISDFSALSDLEKLEKIEASENPWSEILPCPLGASCEYPVRRPESIAEACELSLRQRNTSQKWLGYNLYGLLISKLGLDFDSLEASACEQVSSKLEFLETIDLSDELFISENRTGYLVHLDGLGLLKNLRDVDLSGHLIQSLDELAALENLERLIVERNKVETLASISEFPRLKELSVSGNYELNANGLSSSTLSYLAMGGDRFEQASSSLSIEKLGYLDSLQTLQISHQKIEDLDLITRYNGLKELSLIDTQTTSLTPIWQLSELAKLRSIDNQIEKKECKLQLMDGVCDFGYIQIKAGVVLDEDASSSISERPETIFLELPMISRKEIKVVGTSKYLLAD